MRGDAGAGADSVFRGASVGVEPAAGRSVLLLKCGVVFGWVEVVLPNVRAGGSEAALGAAGVGATAALLPLRISDRERPLVPGCWRPPVAGGVPVDCGKRGRNTDKVPLLLSNRSPRAPWERGASASRMPILRISVRAALSTRDTGMPRLMTRVWLPAMVVEGTVCW
jgi:hypothetical protein